ncbi:16S rRNA (cytosine(967)-C(5))-methyltransferase RsmB [Furfurilactobacillus rossiae]|uniref:16S rRNA (cytosine(967)-C(5))-methyltransferase n=1 Tax=Furfurilactobacillus rossiae DSM 15814 TaxID=1114972 RepID=A0A0R1RKK0_9LACO|nr:16S rRNA (cytosine(967)-C(5))-methyltransferase RsmB [Furfurilactobacillus rossiae]KRL57319.1 16S rRNA methyltransferase B [Furfurilactobacillus rossiae DSM 15814]QFR65807.1 16S rRNA (cytosine(967)-C(5))-methyltransferase RsmB [Furfurilactobacillus rossiae]QLE61211.1 Ribosomal RNA small subunit methyltransferase B [Furfurilactobacillus rossiae]
MATKLKNQSDHVSKQVNSETNPRFVAVSVLENVAKGGYSNLSLNASLDDAQLSPVDAGLCTEIVYGVLQHQLTLDFWLKPFIKQPAKVKPWVLILLRTALFQMQYLDKVPTRAVFDETIQIAKQRGHEGIRRFVTGVLHAVDRHGFADLSTIKDPLTRLSTTYSVPMPWVQQMRKTVGDDKTKQTLASINRPAFQSVRLNPALGERQALLQQLTAAGLKWTDSEVSGEGLRINAGHPAGTPPFNEGLITIQDESAMLPVEALAPQPGDAVLDACAAPGGKTTQIAARLNPSQGGHVTALDLHAHKVALIEANARRMQVSDRITAEQLDARKSAQQFGDEAFDRILVDAPCSGLGLLRRKPEIRYAKTLADSKQLQQIQLAILDAVAPTLKENGILVYSTCTILKQENDDVATAFVKAHPDFELVPVETIHHLKENRSTPWLTIYPDDFGSDGFFVCAFRKRHDND